MVGGMAGGGGRGGAAPGQGDIRSGKSRPTGEDAAGRGGTGKSRAYLSSPVWLRGGPPRKQCCLRPRCVFSRGAPQTDSFAQRALPFTHVS